MLQRQITFVDISIDDGVGRQYQLGRALYSMLSEHHELARYEPPLVYSPSTEDAAQDEAAHYIQGVGGQFLDVAVEALLHPHSTDDSRRIRTFSEFEECYSLDAEDFRSVTDAFWRFHPKRRPILWRILIAQAHLCEMFVSARDTRGAAWANIGRLDMMSMGSCGTFDWRESVDEATDAAVLMEPFNVARAYAATRVPWAAAP